MSQLRMLRRHLTGLPDVKLPRDFRLRQAGPEDARGLADCLQGAFPEKDWPVKSVRRELLQDIEVSAIFVIHGEGGIVATASCKHIAERPHTGYVHWVGVSPTHRGMRLGSAASVAVLRRFVEQGKKEAILDTDDERLAALRTYLGLGFEPVLLDDSHKARWRSVALELARSH